MNVKGHNWKVMVLPISFPPIQLNINYLQMSSFCCDEAFDMELDVGTLDNLTCGLVFDPEIIT